MEIENYPSNTIKTRENTEPTVEKKKVEKVITGQAKTKKKSSFSKFFGGAVADGAEDIKTYLVKDVLIPNVKKAVSDVVDMILYGGNSKRGRTNLPKVSYRSFYDEPRISRAETRPVQGYSYDEVILQSRGDAEEVLSQLNDMIDTYSIASVADLYDLVGITGNYTDNRYGWTNLANADVVRTRDGYMLKLPRAIPIK